MAAGPIAERNQDATIYVGGLDDKVSDTLMWELFVQAGPVVNVHMPKDRVTQTHQGYGFVEFLGEDDADYAIKIMNMIKLYGKPIRVNKASAHQKNLDVGANVFIGNLDPEVDEKLLYDTFSAFGVILQTPKIMRDPETGNSKGFAFINYASFEASDAAIDAMNGQHLCNRPVSVSYAYKKDVKGERHGSAAERLLAAQNPLSQADRPHQLFADAPPTAPLPTSQPAPPPPMGIMGLIPPPPSSINPPPPPVPPPGMPPPLGMPPPPPMAGHPQMTGQPPMMKPPLPPPPTSMTSGLPPQGGNPHPPPPPEMSMVQQQQQGSLMPPLPPPSNMPHPHSVVNSGHPLSVMPPTSMSMANSAGMGGQPPSMMQHANMMGHPRMQNGPPPPRFMPPPPPHWQGGSFHPMSAGGPYGHGPPPPPPPFGAPFPPNQGNRMPPPPQWRPPGPPPPPPPHSGST